MATNTSLLSPNIGLLDGDIFLHRVGFTCEDDPFWVAKARLNDSLDKCLVDTEVSEFQIWLSDNAANNYRYQIYPLYKANRTKPKPVHHKELKAYLIQEWEDRKSVV